MVCVDRIIASAACFQESSSTQADATVSGLERETAAQEGVNVSVGGENGGGIGGKDGVFVGEGCSFSSAKGKGSLRECRICQEEDEEKDMEAPCSCNGTLKVPFLPPFVCMCVCVCDETRILYFSRLLIFLSHSLFVFSFPFVLGENSWLKFSVFCCFQNLSF